MADLLEALVARVSTLEQRLAQIATKEAAFGNARLLGGKRDVGSTRVTSSTSFVDYGAANSTRKTFTKKATDTDLVIEFHVSGFVSTATTADVTIGVQVDADDTAASPFRINANVIQNVHIAWSGFVAIGGVAAGDRDVELRCRVADAGDTFETNSTDRFAYLVWEVPASLTFS